MFIIQQIGRLFKLPEQYYASSFNFSGVNPLDRSGRHAYFLSRLFAVLVIWLISTLFFVSHAYAVANLVVAKTDSVDPAYQSIPFTYTITVTNTAGGSPSNNADNVTVTDALPPGLLYRSHMTSQGSCTTPSVGTNGTVTCALGTINRGNNSATITIEVEASTLGTKSNTASVTATGIGPINASESTDVAPTPSSDYSDAPADGSTAPAGGTTSYGAASHVVTAGIQLGASITDESSAVQDADNTSDDGVSVFHTLTEGDTAYAVQAELLTASGTGTLHAWIDFDGDGVFETSEYDSTTVSSGSPSGDLRWSGQNVAFMSSTWARFRFTSDTQVTSATPSGFAFDGEVEDYEIPVEAAGIPAPTGTQTCTALTGAWSGSGNVWTATTSAGVGVTATFNAAAGAEWVSLGSGTLGALNAYSEPTAPGAPAMSGVFNWDTSAIAVDTPTIPAWTDAATGTVNFVFDTSVRNPILHIDRVGGYGQANPDPTYYPNSSEWTVTTAGASITRLSGVAHFVTETDRFYRDINGTTTATSASTVDTSGTAAGSVMLDGVFSSMDFSLTGIGIEGAGGDGISMAICAEPTTDDYSDAPADGGTAPDGSSTLAYGVATHLVTAGIQLGASITDEASAVEDADNASDDGVTVPKLTAGATADVTIAAGDITASGTGNLYGWIDFDGNGTFDADEFGSTTVSSGTLAGGLTFTGYGTTMVTGTTFARFRLTSDTLTNTDGATAAADGEVEDYAVTVVAGSTTLEASKTVEVWDPLSEGLYALPGNDVIYTISVSNTGASATDSDSVVLIDVMPGDVEFYNGDIDDGGPETDPVSFSQTAGAGLTFTYATDAAYSDSSTKPADFADCAYIPAVGYDPNVTFICLNPKGALASGDPDPGFALSFRARIK